MKLSHPEPTDLLIFVVAVIALVSMWFVLPGCGDTSSVQRAQVAVDTPAPDPRHSITERMYTSWCGPSCYAVTTEHIERGETDTWPADVPTPSFPYQDPRDRPDPDVVCAPVLL